MNVEQNEFTPDSPEIYQNQEILDAQAVADAQAPDVVVDIENPNGEAPASDVPGDQLGGVPQVTPGAPVPEVPTAVAPAQEQGFDRNTQILGLREDEDLSLEARALATKEKLHSEPKVRMMIPLDPGEKAGSYRTVIINGYRFDVKKNVMVDLPQSVANLLADAYSITTEVLEDNPFNLNKADGDTQKALGV